MEDHAPLLQDNKHNTSSRSCFGFFPRNSHYLQKPILKKTIGTLLIGSGMTLTILASAYPETCNLPREDMEPLITVGVGAIIAGFVCIWYAKKGNRHLNQQNGVNLILNVETPTDDAKTRDPSSITAYQIPADSNFGSPTLPQGLGHIGSTPRSGKGSSLT